VCGITLATVRPLDRETCRSAIGVAC